MHEWPRGGHMHRNGEGHLRISSIPIPVVYTNEDQHPLLRAALLINSNTTWCTSLPYKVHV